MIPNRFFFTLVMSVLCGVVTGQYDQVSPIRGASFNGEIMAVSNEAISIEVQGSARSVPVNEVRRVSFKEDPQSLRSARSQVERGNYDSALDSLKRVNTAEIQRDLIKQDFQFYVAYSMGRLALTKGGDKKQAAERMLAFVRSNADSYHFFEAAELLGDLALSMDSLPNAVKYYGAIANKAPWPEYKLRGQLLEAGALLALQDFPQAQAKYEAILESGASTPEQRRMQRLATVGKAKCQALQGQGTAAIEVLESIIAKNDESDTELFGKVYNALGAAYLQQKNTKAALMAYLHVDVLFFSEPEAHAEALYHLAKLWNDLKNADRAVTARNTLDSRYAGSKWASAQ